MSRELDIEVAKKLGWTDFRKVPHDWARSPVDGYRQACPKWSNDMNAAMELWQDGWTLDRDSETRQWCIFIHHPGVEFKASTPAEAICLAYLGEKNG